MLRAKIGLTCNYPEWLNWGLRGKMHGWIHKTSFPEDQETSYP